MKILYFVNCITNSGGIERIVTDKVNYLAEMPNSTYDIHLAYYGNGNETPFYRLDTHKVKLHPIDLNSTINSFTRRLATLPLLYKQIKQLIQEVKPDIIVNESMRLVSYLLPFAFKAYPLIYVIHFSYEGLVIMDNECFHNVVKSRVLMWMRQHLLGKYDRFVVLTEEDKHQWKMRNVKVIPNFINSDSPQPSKLESKKAICVGRLVYQKDMPMLIRSWGKVTKEKPEWTLDIWGKGEEYNALATLIKDLKLENKVFLRGTSQTIADEYNKASLFILPSRYEGFALVVLEAMNMGLPCISFDIPGCNNVIRHGVNGYLVAERSEIKLAEAVLQYIGLAHSEKERMQQAALSTGKSYDIEAVMKKWMDMFDILIRQKRNHL